MTKKFGILWSNVNIMKQRKMIEKLDDEIWRKYTVEISEEKLNKFKATKMMAKMMERNAHAKQCCDMW